MAGSSNPTETFQHTYLLNGPSTSSYANGHEYTTYTVNSSLNSSAAVTDFVGPTDPSTDNLTQLGDVAHDEFHVANGSNTIDASYSGLVEGPNRGIVFSYYLQSARNFEYILATDGTYKANSSVKDLYTYNNQTDTTDSAAVFALACFASGTLIRTSGGDVPVESLAVGDLATTSSGAHRPVRWLGHRKIDCRRHRDAQPIRIAAHAFGADRPARDLVVSPGHAICVDLLGEVLIPACALVNGSTIRQVEVDEVTYWHVELDSHDVILSENLPTESYIDTGNRGFFEESDVVDLCAGPDGEAARHTTDDYCRPIYGDGPVVEGVRQQLRARAETLGWHLQHDDLGDLHLVVDGVRVEPARRGLSVCFALPPAARDVWLVSNAVRPCDVEASGDQRTLGANLAAIALVDGFKTIAVALDDPRLDDGFSGVEQAGEAMLRWTTGRARLHADLWEDCVGPRLLRLDLARAALPAWVAADASATDASQAPAAVRAVS